MNKKDTVIYSTNTETSIETDLENGLKLKMSVVNVSADLPTEPICKTVTLSITGRNVKDKEVVDGEIREVIGILSDYFHIEEEVCDFCRENRVCFHMYTSLSKGNDDKLSVCKRCSEIVSRSMREFFNTE